MKPKLVFFFLIVLINPLIAQNQNSNIFLPKKFLSFQTYVPVVDKESKGLVKLIHKKNINELVFDKVLTGKVKAYGINNFDDYFPYIFKITDTLKPSEIIADLSKHRPDNKFDLNEIKYYNFVEEWIYDAEVFAFEKKVMAYQPVREYRDEEGEIGSFRHKISLTILNSENVSPASTIPLMQVKSDFYFEIPDNLQVYTKVDGIQTLANDGVYLQSKLTPYWNSNVRGKLVKSVFDRVLGNSIPVFDAQNGEYIAISEVKKNVGIKVDTIMMEVYETGDMVKKSILSEFNPLEIKSMYFIENWFINPENLNLRKEVEAIVPFRFYYKNSDDSVCSKEAIGTIYFDNENKERIELIYKQLLTSKDIQACVDGIELFTNLYDRSKNLNFKALCKEKQLSLINNLNKQNQDDEESLDMIQESKKIKP